MNECSDQATADPAAGGPLPAQRKQVEALAGYGFAEADIATALAIDPEVLRRLYPSELAGAHIKANARVAESLFRRATGEGREAVTAAIFWLKTRAQWKETVVNEVTHEAGGTVKQLMEQIAANGDRIHDRHPIALAPPPEDHAGFSANGRQPADIPDLPTEVEV
jgi:hypothetical protein